MDLNLIASIAASVGTLVAGVALFLNYRQLRGLDRSVRGNTYQQLASFALGFHCLLLEHPELNYLYTADAPDEKARNQRILDRIVANYLENMWFQCQLGLLGNELDETFVELLRHVLAEHPGVAEHMTKPNFARGLRTRVQDELSRRATHEGGSSTVSAERSDSADSNFSTNRVAS